jgi:D-inositol-3-phosphate glycosyltransferase
MMPGPPPVVGVPATFGSVPIRVWPGSEERVVTPVEPTEETIMQQGASPSSVRFPTVPVADDLARWRHHFWHGTPAPACGRDLLGLLSAAEYRRGEPEPRTAELPASDLHVAALRKAVRSGVALSPDTLVAADSGAPMLGGVLAEAWAVTVASGRPQPIAAVLRRRLLADPPSSVAAFLLDLADAHGLRPLTAEECVARAHGSDRRERHATWRYLSGVPRGARVLPDPATWTGDPYERLLLAAAWGRLLPGSGRAEIFRQAVRALPRTAAAGTVVAQSMLLGRLDEPGTGLSGGMSVLLGGLGDAMTATSQVGRVLTVVTAETPEIDDGIPLAARRGTGHWVLRIPTDGSGPLEPGASAAYRPALAWWAGRLLTLPGARPRVVHARFADDGSVAMADAARRCGARFVFTATPDPHRTLTERYGGVQARPDGELAGSLRADLHRIFVADRLVERSDLVVGIPTRSGSEGLAHHFPQLAADPASRRIVSPPEGIPRFDPAPGDEELAAALMRRLFAGGERIDALDPADRGLRLLVTVGRLHPVKQQDRLVQAWLEAGLHRTTVLLLVGGSAAGATDVEAEMRARIAKLLAAVPAAGHRVAQWPALPNRQVRVLERALASGRWCGPAVYVCPSAKEEFGLAVLEAMEAGLPVAGPRRGGVPHYVRDGVSGFLLPTDCLDALGRRLAEVCEVPADRLAEVADRGRATVAGRYSAEAMAGTLAAEYAALLRASGRPGPVDGQLSGEPNGAGTPGA